MFTAIIVTAVLAGCLAVVVYQNNIMPTVAFPPHPMPKVNGLDDIEVAVAVTPTGTAVGPMSSSKDYYEWTQPELDAWMVLAQPALTIIKGSLKKTFCLPADRDAHTISPAFGLSAKMRETARTCSSASYVYYRRADYTRASDCGLDALELSAVCDHGGPVIAATVARAIQSMSLPCIESSVGRLSSADLEHAADRLSAIKKKQRHWTEIVMEEKYMSVAHQMQIIKDSSPIFSKRKAIRQRIEYFDQVLKESRKPYEVRSSVTPPTILNWITDGYIQDVHVRVIERDAQMAVLRAWVAVLRYQKDTGSYPPSLKALVPRYLEAVPIDPFGGATRPPLIYHKTASGFLLYSLGPDMKDDGGVPATPKTILHSGDIVAGKLTEPWEPFRATAPPAG